MKEESLTVLGFVIFIVFFSGALPAWFYWATFATLIALVSYGVYIDFKETH